MVKQERAARTRSTVLRSAAAQFDLDGYAGASLAKISKAAGISLGAVTFHFSSKADLAEAVEAEGRATVRAAIERIEDISDTPLRHLADLTLELARLIEHEDTVRALLRLERERPGDSVWTEIWLPTADELLQQAYDNGDLQPSAHPKVMAALIVHLMAGAEVVFRRHRAAGLPTPDSSVELLSRIWQLVMTGAADEPLPGPGRGPRRTILP
jgi:AcrR family transcriptional regulator